MLVGQVLIGGTWSFAIYGKGVQQRIFLHNEPSASESVPVFKFQLRPGPLVPWVVRGGAWFQVQLKIKVLSSAPALAAGLGVWVCCL